jgi:hypothetical protein
MLVGSPANPATKDQCATCPADCAHCENGECLECKANYFLDLTTKACSASCAIGFYPDTTTPASATNPATGTCQQCDSACTSCTGKAITTCTGCKKGWFFATQALHGQSGCVACADSCEECNAPGNAGCTKCKEVPSSAPGNVVRYYNAGTTSTGNAECVA